MLFPARVKLAVAALVVAGGSVAAALLGPAGPAVGQASGPIQVQIQVHLSRFRSLSVSEASSLQAAVQQLSIARARRRPS